MRAVLRGRNAAISGFAWHATPECWGIVFDHRVEDVRETGRIQLTVRIGTRFRKI